MLVVPGRVYYDAFQQRAEELGVAHAVRSLGAVPKSDDPGPPRRRRLESHEQGCGLGTATLESMAAGAPGRRPGAASTTSPPSRCRRDDILLAAPGDVDGLADGSGRPSDDPAPPAVDRRATRASSTGTSTSTGCSTPRSRSLAGPRPRRAPIAPSRRRPPPHPTHHQEEPHGIAETVFFTGGAGFIGLHVVPMLLEQGYRVRIFDNMFRGDRDAVAAVDGGDVELIDQDVRYGGAVHAAMKGCSKVIHAAAVSINKSQADPYESHRHQHDRQPQRLRRRRRPRCRPPRLLLSASVYGDPRSSRCTRTTRSTR